LVLVKPWSLASVKEALVKQGLRESKTVQARKKRESLPLD
jgi:hypothetical protein